MQNRIKPTPTNQTGELMNHPIQPLYKTESGTMRFKGNAIVQHLLDTHQTSDMNKLACLYFTDEDRQQFAQLIGYSLSGYGELSYVSDDAYGAATTMADEQLNEKDARIAYL
jgi:hypothetical protein